MKIILIIPCVLYFAGVVDVVEAADKHLRGSSRDLQFGQSDAGRISFNDPFAITTVSTNPVEPQPSTSLPSFFLPDNAPVSENDPFTFSTNPGVSQPTDPVDTPTYGGFGGGGDFDFKSVFSLPSLSEDFQTGTGGDGGSDGDLNEISSLFLDPPVDAPAGSGVGGIDFDFALNTGSGGSNGCQGRKSEGVCPAVYDPVICEGGCQFSNSCKAQGAGFAANQCRPN